MKGLLIKDFYMFKKYMRSFILVFVIFFAVSALGQSSTFMVIYPIILMAMTAVTLISYDERFHWDRYCDAMPCTRAQAVSEKYIITVIGVTVCFGLTALTQYIAMRRGAVDMEGYVSVLSAALCFGFGAPSVLLPVIFAFGAEKGRIAYYICIGFMCALSVLVMDNDALVNTSLGSVSISPLALFPAAAVLFAASWLLSIKLYKKREL